MYRDLALYYARNGTLWLAVWGNFTLDGGGNPTGYTVTAAREFRYDSPRHRYMSRDYDVSGGNTPANWTPNDLASWTDHYRTTQYMDFDLDHDGSNDATIDEQTRYLVGQGIVARQDDTTAADEFLHGDLIRSTVMTTDSSGTVAATVSYTAFGQLVTSSGIGGELPSGFPRYAYAGGWGYESDLLVLDGAAGTEPIVLAHVGARWYQADTGRFIMRDPLGIMGGMNVYVYASNNPLIMVDPDGESIWAIIGGIVLIWTVGNWVYDLFHDAAPIAQRPSPDPVDQLDDLDGPDPRRKSINTITPFLGSCVKFSANFGSKPGVFDDAIGCGGWVVGQVITPDN